MKQYTKEEIAACVKVVCLENDRRDGNIIWAGDVDNTPVDDMEPLPNGEKWMYNNELHNPDQYPWPKSGKCVEYRLEPSLEEDLKQLAARLQDGLDAFNSQDFSPIIAGSAAATNQILSELQFIINKHYPEL